MRSWREKYSPNVLTKTPLSNRPKPLRFLKDTFPTTLKELNSPLRKQKKLLQLKHPCLPGTTKNNRAGNTEFVDKQLVAGTLKKGFEWYSLLKEPFAKAAYMMFQSLETSGVKTIRHFKVSGNLMFGMDLFDVIDLTDKSKLIMNVKGTWCSFKRKI